MQISSNLPPYPNLSTELCHFALLLSTGSIYCEFTASQHCAGQNRYERANTDRTIERHGWFDRSLRNNARASQATEDRKGVVKGKSVVERVDLVGRRRIKKKTSSIQRDVTNKHK